MSVFGTEEVEFIKESLVDEAIDALFEKRFATLLHQCLNCIKKGSSKEISLASRTIGLLALTVGPGVHAQEILKESITPLSQAFNSGSESSKIISLLNCSAVITFVGASGPEEIEKSMQIMWQIIHPKLGSNVIAIKPSAPIITTAVSSWSFLLTTMDGWRPSPKLWQESVTYLSNLLDNDNRSMRIAAGEALSLIFEMESLGKFVAETKGYIDSSALEGNKTKDRFSHIKGLKGKILNQARDLSMEAGGKGSSKKDLNNQRNMFRDVLEFLEYGYPPETTMKIGGVALQTLTWSQLIQLNFLKRFLGGGFAKRMQESEFLQDVFGFTPKRRNLRMYKSPNSVVNKARTQQLNKQRMLSEGRNIGHFAICVGYEDS
ncbi:hypothetical protein Golax_008707 [Gossypium laxum]|uniref:Interferon-related developmental regulator N-terminal domain-containing protein n=1 Tax=Gossypium laxum TaxID=34288 RepID=A0A7J9AAW1_9ROSI|nr:hypothetical protein [Gossypium laxum]